MEIQNDKKSTIFFIIISISLLACGIIGCVFVRGDALGLGWGIWNGITFIVCAIVGFSAAVGNTRRYTYVKYHLSP